MMKELHYSVLLNETIQNLKVKPNGTYVDLTVGMGGHSSKILENLTTGLLVGFDKDEFAIKTSKKRLSQINDRFILIKSDFSNLKDQLSKINIQKVDGIIADLGVSSPQVDDYSRGFSYNKDARLDMRMDRSQTLDAHFVVNNYNVEKLEEIFIKYADVKLAKQVAKVIIKNRPITSTLELVDIIKQAYPAALLRAKNPAKAVFQAIRIEVNLEFDSLRKMLEEALTCLNAEASICIITFHSLEDKIVKNFFGSLIKSKIPAKMPIIEKKQYTAKQIRPSKLELNENKRSRSAKLRILTKLF